MAGARNGLSQVVLKIAAPGVPDFYQGTEFWNFSLVDPDNRRPVDYERRTPMLGHTAAARGRRTASRWFANLPPIRFRTR